MIPLIFFSLLLTLLCDSLKSVAVELGELITLLLVEHNMQPHATRVILNLAFRPSTNHVNGLH